MTSYVTREEYDRLRHRMETLESEVRGGVIKLEITVTGGDVDDRVAALVRDGVQRGLRDYQARHSSMRG